MGAVNVPLRLLQWTVASFIEKIQEDMLRDASQNVRKCVHRGFRRSLQALSQVILKMLSSHIIEFKIHSLLTELYHCNLYKCATRVLKPVALHPTVPSRLRS